jgi:DHA1 family tetracycline resistance protein-like MFS transporter
MTNRPVLWLVFLTIVLDMLGVGLLIPVFPQLIAPSSPTRIVPADWSVSDAYILGGWLLATFPLFQFLSTPVLGQLSDRHGRKRILALSIAGSAFSMLLFAFAIHRHDLPLMFLARALDGATGGNISVAQAVIGDISAPKDRARNFGLVGVAIGLGFIMGPFLGGILCDPSFASWTGTTTPFLVVAALAAVNALLVLRFLPETRPQGDGAPRLRMQWTRSLSNIGKVFAVPELRMTLPALFFFNAGFTYFSTFWGVVLAEDFGFDGAAIGGFFGYMGVMIVLAQGTVVRRMPDRIRDASILPYSMLLVAASLVPYVFIPREHVALIWWIPPFMAVGMALTRSNGTALLVRITPESVRGEVMGIHSSAYALAQLVPSALSGYVAAQHARMPVLAGAASAFVGWLLFVWFYKEPGTSRADKA